MTAYYNEIDEYAAAWLRNLIAAGLIPAGDVDTRSIVDVRSADLVGYRQCHFFAGIGGWALAARLAGWPDDRELWTGSCPCQPFSAAGKQQGTADARHLWPDFHRLIAARRPAVVMGEQVAAAVGLHWLDRVQSDLEASDYEARGVVLPACAVNAPQRRERLWFVADRRGERSETGISGSQPGKERDSGVANNRCHQGDVVDADIVGASAEREQRGWEQLRPGGDSWARHSWIIGHDGKARRVEPAIRLLAHGVPARVGRLRAYGNAIVPQVAAEVIRAYMDCLPLEAAA